MTISKELAKKEYNNFLYNVVQCWKGEEARLYKIAWDNCLEFVNREMGKRSCPDCFYIYKGKNCIDEVSYFCHNRNVNMSGLCESAAKKFSCQYFKQSELAKAEDGSGK